MARNIARSDSTSSTRLAVISATCAVREALSAALAQREPAFLVARHDEPAAPFLASLAEGDVDVVLVDGSCRASLTALSTLRELLPDTPLVVYGVQPVRDTLLICARNGATVVASHAIDLDALVELIKRAASRDLRGEAELNATLLGELAALDHRLPMGAVTSLTRRERQIALAIAEGLSNKEIAQRLHISLPTVKTHVHCILRKLGVASRDEVPLQLGNVAAA